MSRDVLVTLSQIALERSGLQYTPGGQYLVLLDSIRTPYCRSIISADSSYTKYVKEKMEFLHDKLRYIFSGKGQFLVCAQHVHQAALRRMR